MLPALFSVLVRYTTLCDLLIRGNVIQTAYKCYLGRVAQDLQPGLTVSTIITMVV